eukprot:GHVT01072478.1.p1 GENE.GHVT01072478.1~~GHVT01072478.1.p1  ORF type:complete len:229 (-),score=22.92 GHVT01072478.1:131-817(-)
MRIFIDNVNSYLSGAIISRLRRFGGRSHRVFGTLTTKASPLSPGSALDTAVRTLENVAPGTSKENEPENAASPYAPAPIPAATASNPGTPPPGVHRVVIRRSVDALLKVITSCSLVVVDLHTADLALLERLIIALRDATLTKKLVFILVSSVHVWADTPRTPVGSAASVELSGAAPNTDEVQPVALTESIPGDETKSIDIETEDRDSDQKEDESIKKIKTDQGTNTDT